MELRIGSNALGDLSFTWLIMFSLGYKSVQIGGHFCLKVCLRRKLKHKVPMSMIAFLIKFDTTMLLCVLDSKLENILTCLGLIYSKEPNP